MNAQYETIGALAFLAVFNKTGNLRVIGRRRQYRVLDAQALERRRCESGSNRRDGECDWKGDRTCAHGDCADAGGKRQRQSRPPDWLVLCGKIEGDAETEGDRQPWDKPPGS